MTGKARVPEYHGSFGDAQADRLLWRAGFGPRNQLERQQWAALGLHDAVQRLLNPPAEQLTGPPPTDRQGRPIAPVHAWGHDHLWWLDRMVRSNQPLVERMTLNWHDWFATSIAGAQPNLVFAQNRLLRRHALGSFRRLTLEITRDPAMLLWLSGTANTRWHTNENYARELMELFTLGAGRGYTERDVRQAARALTGFANDWSESRGAHNFRYRRDFHDPAPTRIFGRRGRHDWRDVVNLCIRHRNHPSFLVAKLWGYFISVAPPAADRRALERLYVTAGHNVKPVIAAILKHPLLYEGPPMLKPPVVMHAGMIRVTSGAVTDEAWAWIGGVCGQRLFEPPNVSGWDESRWLDTSTFRGHVTACAHAVRRHALDPKQVPDSTDRTPAAVVARARAFCGDPLLNADTEQQLVAYVERCTAAATANWQRRMFPVLAENALRSLIFCTSDWMTC